MIDPLKPKYFPLYWKIAFAAAEQSVAERHKVGAVIVTPTGMISLGFNGMPPGLPNACENMEVYSPELGIYRGKTDPRVIHAEANAVDKMTCQGIPVKGSLLFVTRSPCFECAKRLINLDLKYIYYVDIHDCTRGLELFDAMGIAHSVMPVKR